MMTSASRPALTLVSCLALFVLAGSVDAADCNSTPTPAPTPPSAPTLCYGDAGLARTVSSGAALQNDLTNASAGNRIIITGGTYSDNYTLSSSGTASAPIIITAAPGATVTMTGTFTLSGQYAVLTGIQFVNGQVKVNGDFNRITRNRFTKFARTAVTLNSGAANNRIDRNEFDNMVSGSTATYVAVSVNPASGDSTTTNNRIDHNYFHDFPDWNVNGHEAIWLGHSVQQNLSTTKTLIDHNLFQRTNGDGEIIKSVTNYNQIIGNTFLDSRAYASNRQSKGTLWKNNWFEGVDGLRTLGDDLQIIGNNFAGSSALRLQAGDTTWDAIVAALPQYSKLRPATQRALVVGNNGKIIVGYNPTSLSYPARSSSLQANSGTITREFEVGTLISSSTTISYGQAVKLSATDVGRAAADDCAR
jgi:chondroitinase B-like protein